MDSSKPSSSLPFELVEEILYKTPISSLGRFKSTCKQWNTFLSTKEFIYKHLDLSHEQFIRVGKDSDSFQILNTMNQDLSDTPVLSCKGPYKISTMVHCDGLLLCTCSFKGLAVWNPSLKQIKWIKPPNLLDVFGFGYDNVSRGNYKILSFCAKKRVKEIKIYDFNSSFWRSVNVNFPYKWYLHPQLQNISMKGTMYWIAMQRGKCKTHMEFFIQSFDFSTETFKPICSFPFESEVSSSDKCDHIVTLSGFRGDRLSLLCQQDHVEIEVWVTNKVDDEVVSWTKYFSMTPPDILMLHSCINRIFPAYFISKTSMNIMLWCEEKDVEKRYVKFYELGEGKIKKQVETGRHDLDVPLTYSSYVYVPSLVPVPS